MSSNSCTHAKHNVHLRYEHSQGGGGADACIHIHTTLRAPSKRRSTRSRAPLKTLLMSFVFLYAALGPETLMNNHENKS